MFARFTRLFRKPSPVAVPAHALDPIPAHKGFAVTATIGAMRHVYTFPTLQQAQAHVAWHKAEARAWVEGLAARGMRSNTRRAYAIRNLETGQFAPFLWTCTRADIA